MHITSIQSGAVQLAELIALHGRLEAESPIVVEEPNTTASAQMMTLKRAAELPELSDLITVKGMRAAIAKGDLKARQPGGPAGTLYVTYADIMDWIASWQPANPHVSGLDQPITTRTPERFERRPRGSSSMDVKRESLASALKLAQQLSKR